MKCYVCGNEVGFDYRVNSLGDEFCNNQCYENENSGRSSSDNDHPYIDAYDMIRMDYLFWKNEWKNRIDLFDIDYMEKANELYAIMNSFIYDHLTFYMNEGDDGIFAFEIYQYLRKIELLQDEILAWRPDRDVFYNVYLLFEQEYLNHRIMSGTDYSEASSIFKRFITDNHQETAEELIDLLDQGYSEVSYYIPTEDDFVLIFSSIEEAEHAKRAFRKVFTEQEIEIIVEKSHFCDCGCGLYVGEGNLDSALADEGWHYSDYCSCSKDM